jgi:hypothetical protein
MYTRSLGSGGADSAARRDPHGDTVPRIGVLVDSARPKRVREIHQGARWDERHVSCAKQWGVTARVSLISGLEDPIRRSRSASGSRMSSTLPVIVLVRAGSRRKTASLPASRVARVRPGERRVRYRGRLHRSAASGKRRWSGSRHGAGRRDTRAPRRCTEGAGVAARPAAAVDTMSTDAADTISTK